MGRRWIRSSLLVLVSSEKQFVALLDVGAIKKVLRPTCLNLVRCVEGGNEEVLQLTALQLSRLINRFSSRSTLTLRE